MSNELQHEKALTVREKMALWVLLVIFKVIKPMHWTHDLSKEVEQIHELLKQ